MKTYLAYFDLLGFKDFIERNDFETQKKVMRNILRDIENATADGRLKDAPYGVVADLSYSTIQVLNFSDTILFWTQDDSEESLIEILKVAYRYNWGATTYFFPARGALAHGEIQHLNYTEKNEKGGAYHVNSIFGKGLIDAYQKAEAADWSGAIIDFSVIEKIKSFGKDPKEFLTPYAKIHQIPYRDGLKKEGFAFKLCVEPINNEVFSNVSRNIRENFAAYNKRVDSDGVEGKIKNTLEFLETAKQ